MTTLWYHLAMNEADHEDDNDLRCPACNSDGVYFSGTQWYDNDTLVNTYTCSVCGHVFIDFPDVTYGD